MTKLEELYEYAHKDRIAINDFSFSDTKKGACVCLESTKTILLDMSQIDTLAEETSVLAEEYAHYATGSLYVINSNYHSPAEHINRVKCERRADKWAIKKLVPKDELGEAIQKGNTEIWDLAEYFNVTEAFMLKAVEYYTERCGIQFGNGQEI